MRLPAFSLLTLGMLVLIPTGGAGTQRLSFVLDGVTWTYQDDGLQMTGILLKPDGNGPFPAIIISHGLGGNAQGFGMAKAHEMVKWGFVCIAPNYTHAGTPRRGTNAPDSPPDRSQAGASPENLRRAKACVAILRAQPYVDSKRICAYGNSMGAFVTITLAANMGRQLAAAAISAGGIADQPYYPTTEAAGRIECPFLIIHGSADRTVPPESSERLKAVLDANGVPNERHIFEGIGHQAHAEKAAETYELLLAFFRRHGVLSTPTPPSERPRQIPDLSQGQTPSRPTFNPTFDLSTLRPFTEGTLYVGKYETCLYPGSNEIPKAHQEAGIRIAATIQPLDTGGKPDAANGRILALVMGHSNCRLYFDALGRELTSRAGELHPRFELLNAAFPGQQLPELRTFEGPVYDRAKQLLSRPGYSAAQVQVLFLHTTYHGAGNVGNEPPRPFPQTMQNMQADLAALLEHCLKLYPNLKIAYLTSDGLRQYTAFEPHVWQEAFAFKWLLESQIKGETAVAFEDKPGRPRRLPWLQWGPYIWDSTWDRSYFRDGVHPADKARAIFVQKYWALLSNDPVARPWLLKPEN